MKSTFGWTKYCLDKWMGRRQPFMPDELRQDDVFVVSYPKSGNTWVRFLLANALYPNADVDFHTIHELIPEVGNEDERRSELPSPRLLKSHAPYRSVYPQTIYILRDGRDVYVSFYHYKKPDLPEEMTFEEFLERDHWPTRWAEHVTEWMEAAAVRDDILIVRYEDLKENSTRELKRMLSFIDRDEIPECRIHCAAEASSFENMRRLEQERGRRFGQVEQFVRKGEAKGGNELFSERARDIFKRRDGNVLSDLGYEEDDW
jgi:hypothetical protein